jgi:hypothetical protein
MNTPTADFLLRLEEELETDIRDCLRLLDLGREEALRVLQDSKNEVGATLAGARQHFLQTAGATQHQLEAVQQSLGRLGMALHQFVMTDPLEVEDLEGFDTWRALVLRAFEHAKEELELIEVREDQVWRADLERVWRRFRQQVEVVKMRLALDSEHAQEEMEAERTRLRERLNSLQEQIRQDPKGARVRIQQMAGTRQDDPEVSRMGGWIKAILMWIDYPAADSRRKEGKTPGQSSE